MVTFPFNRFREFTHKLMSTMWEYVFELECVRRTHTNKFTALYSILYEVFTESRTNGVIVIENTNTKIYYILLFVQQHVSFHGLHSPTKDRVRKRKCVCHKTYCTKYVRVLLQLSFELDFCLGSKPFDTLKLCFSLQTMVPYTPCQSNGIFKIEISLISMRISTTNISMQYRLIFI